MVRDRIGEATNAMKNAADSVKNVGANVKDAAMNPGRTMYNAANLGVGAVANVGGAAVSGVTKGGIYWIFLAAGLYLLDLFFLGFNGLNIRDLVSEIMKGDFSWIIRSFGFSVGAIIGAAYLVFKKPSKEEFMAFMIFIFTTNLILNLAGFWLGNLATIIHVIFTISMMFFLLKNAMPMQDAYILGAIIIFIDFYLFSIIGYFPNLSFFNRLIIPIHFIIVLMYTKDSTFKNIIVFCLIVFYLLQVVGTYQDYRDFGDTLGVEERQTLTSSIARAYKNAVAIGTNVKQDAVETAKQTINQTKRDLTGEAYVSKVDEKSKQNLGISITDFKTESTTYNENDTVKVFGILKGRSADSDESIVVTITCQAKSGNNKIIIGNISGKKSKEIEMKLYDQKSITCVFNDMKKGYYTIQMNASFNYTSAGYLKTYFIDEERYNTLKSQGVDIFDVYGISEKRPVSKSVNGPGKIGIGSLDPPIKITKEKNKFNSYIGVSIVNGWNTGTIKKIRNVKISIPNGIDIEQSCKDERFTFSTYKGFGTEETTYEYSTERKKEIKDRKFVQAFNERCNLVLNDAKTILNDAPFVTKYFKGEIEYEYLLKKKVTVSVKG